MCWQDCLRVWELNGGIYLINIEFFKVILIIGFQVVRKYVMSEEDLLDIDIIRELEFVRFLLEYR